MWEDGKYQKMYYMAKRLGKLSDNNQKLDVDSYLKDCVETLFWKIEKKFGTMEFGIRCMKKKMEKLEGNLEDDWLDVPIMDRRIMTPSEARRVRLKMTKDHMCENLKKHGKCEDLPYCTKAHCATELDVVSDQLKYGNIVKAIAANETKMKDSDTMLPWRYTGFKDKVDDRLDAARQKREKALKVPDEEDLELQEMRNKTTKASVFQRDTQWLNKLPYERKGENDFGEDRQNGEFW